MQAFFPSTFVQLVNDKKKLNLELSYETQSFHIFFEIPHKTLKFQEKSKKNAFSSDLETKIS